MIVRGSNPIAGLIMGSLLAVVGFGVAFWLGKPIRDKAVASTSWPDTEGRIIRSSLVTARNKGKTHYTADIEYEYALEGNILTGSRVWFGDDYSSSSGSEFRSAVSRYPVGRQVRVHYDPADPTTSVLERGVTWSSGVIYWIGLGMLAIGATILLSVLVPLLFVVFALVRSFRPEPHDELRDFDRSRPTQGQGPSDQHRDADVNGDDDGITIG